MKIYRKQTLVKTLNRGETLKRTNTREKEMHIIIKFEKHPSSLARR